MLRTGLQTFSGSICLFFTLISISGCGGQSSSSQSDQATGTPLVTPSAAFLLPGQALQFSVTSNGAPLAGPLWYVNSVLGGTSTTGTISATGLYTAPSGSSPASVQVSALDVAHGISSAPVAVSLLQPGHLPTGLVSPSNNPLVALYTITVPEGTATQIQFGTSTSYGLSTWAQPAPQGGGVVSIYVAGMRASTTYHMQAVTRLPDGSQVTDTDHTFTTGAISSNQLLNITTQLSGVGTPSPGVELLSITDSDTQNLLCAVATDLDGNVIWYYPLPVGTYPEPIKLLPNGHMLLVTAGTTNDIREIDLAGNLINQVTTDQITGSLAAIPSFQNTLWGGLNHDVLSLPNGHLILLGSIYETINGELGIPAGTVVEGNALIDWDPQLGAVWTWSTFDHLDLTRAPYGISDWTHANAVIYSPDDSDLILSMRNQNWIVKINYDNGAGDGSILWRLGPGGDFSLPNQEAPIEWNYGQHYPTIQSTTSSGIFSLMFFNNGNNRLMDSNNDICGTPGVGACYSSVPIYQLNENNLTASVLWEDNLSPAYSICCGDALVLPNGNVEFDVAYDLNTPNVSYVEEVTQTQTPELIWKMNVQNQTGFTDLLYRGFRIPSLYPGIEWTQSAIQSANANAAVQTRPSSAATENRMPNANVVKP